MPTVFLDYQSSTPVLPQALEAMLPFFTKTFGNPSSLHQHGLRAREALRQARERFAALIHAEPADIIFTSGGTEAANLAIKGVAWANERRGRHIVVSAIEHPAVLGSAEFLENHGFSCTRVEVDRHGAVNPERLEAVLRDDTILVCVQHANHDVGTIQSLTEIAAVTNRRGVPLFVDAVASAGWVSINVQELGLSLLSLSPHRFYGPKGVGMLYRSRGVRLASLIHGGDQEAGRRAGTENIPSIVGGGIAAEVALAELDARRSHTARIQRRLWDNLRGTVSYLALNGPDLGAGRISTNLNVSAEFTEGEAQLLCLDMAGVAVASGTSCVSRAVKISPVFQALGIDRAIAQASVIFSLGKDQTDGEIDSAAAAYAKVVEKLRAMSPSWEDFQNGRVRSILEAAAPKDLASAASSS